MRPFWEAVRPLIPLGYLCLILTMWVLFSVNEIIMKEPRMFFVLTGTLFSNICVSIRLLKCIFLKNFSFLGKKIVFLFIFYNFYQHFSFQKLVSTNRCPNEWHLNWKIQCLTLPNNTLRDNFLPSIQLNEYLSNLTASRTILNIRSNSWSNTRSHSLWCWCGKFIFSNIF